MRTRARRQRQRQRRHWRDTYTESHRNRIVCLGFFPRELNEHTRTCLCKHIVQLFRVTATRKKCEIRNYFIEFFGTRLLLCFCVSVPAMLDFFVANVSCGVSSPPHGENNSTRRTRCETRTICARAHIGTERNLRILRP